MQPTTSDRPRMVLPYISDRRIGDGYRTAFVLRTDEGTATLYVPTKLATVTVPPATLARAGVVPYRPALVRARILERVRCFRRHGRRFPRRATVELLRRLGAGEGSIGETVGATPLPETVAARGRRSAQAEERAELAYVAAAIRAKIEMQLTEISTSVSRRRPRARARQAHPDQLVLAL